LRTSIAAVVVLGLLGLAAVPPAAGSGEPSIEVRPDVTLTASDGTELRLDAYLPGDGAGRPAIVLVHGGSWAGGDKADVANIGAGLADRGWAVFALGYRLGVEQVPRQAEDVRDAVAWVRRHADELGVDPNAISLLGASAGGHLAALAAIGAPRRARVAAVATWSGIFDLASLAPHGDGPVPGCGRQCQQFFGAGVLTGVVGCTYDECPGQYRGQSPVTRVDETSPPMFIAATTGDAVPPSQAREMAAALRAAGVESEVAVLEGDEHGYDVGARVLDRTLDFLEGRTLEDASSSSASSTPVALGAALVAIVLLAVLAVVVGARRRRRARVDERLR
jgi:acetyl esterase/lipase